MNVGTDKLDRTTKYLFELFGLFYKSNLISVKIYG